MAQLDVVFSLPEDIKRGLADGSLDRRGGVILDNSSKQVVLWLEECGASPGGAELDSASLFEFGISLYADIASAQRLRSIEHRLKLIQAQVQAILDNQVDELTAHSQACVEDVRRRVQSGQEFSADLMRETRHASLRLSGYIDRLAREGMKAARDEGSVFGWIWGAEGAADRRAGAVGCALAEMLDLYVSLKIAEGICSAGLGYLHFSSWRSEFLSVIYAVADELPAAGQYGLTYVRQHGVPWKPNGQRWKTDLEIVVYFREIALEFSSGREVAKPFAVRAGGATPAQMPQIVRGIRLVASILDWLAQEQSEEEILRLCRARAGTRRLSSDRTAEGRGETDRAYATVKPSPPQSPD
jgi:hypothetical protein